MPRRARMYIPGFTYHIVQRGNNREACFLDEDAYVIYLELLRQAIPKYGVRLHAYCLMTNHVHLLMTPEHAVPTFGNKLKTRSAYQWGIWGVVVHRRLYKF